MRNQHPVCLVLLSVVLALTLSGPCTAVADPGSSAAQKSFEQFVNVWMSRLDRIGKMNILGIDVMPRDQGFVGYRMKKNFNTPTCRG